MRFLSRDALTAMNHCVSTMNENAACKSDSKKYNLTLIVRISTAWQINTNLERVAIKVTNNV
jgi:hypothetical protein